MSNPISPKPVLGHEPDYLPPFISNGLIGLRVREIPLIAGVASVSGLVGVDPVTQIIGSPYAPYPLAGNIQIGALSLEEAPHLAHFVEQSYDFATGELTTRFEFHADGTVAQVEVLTFCSRTKPMLVLQETTVELNRGADLILGAMVDPRGIAGHWQRRWTSVPGEDTELVDGTLSWQTYGEIAQVGASYSTELLGETDFERSTIEEEMAPLGTNFRFRARARKRYVLRQFASLVPSSLHKQPESEAIRLVADGCLLGFDQLRTQNRAAWQEVWRGRIVLHGADQRWQALADAAFYYLHSVAHPSSGSSVHIFGLARWPNYHYYYGHVMWDLEAFVVPPLTLLMPDAARTMLEYRWRSLDAARRNARLRGYRGVLYPWESDSEHGEDATIGTAKGAATEQHVNMAIALAFARYAHATGDEWFLREEAWPVLRGVADWIADRAERTDRGFQIRRAMGIAERESSHDNNAYVNMSAAMSLREAVCAARRIGLAPPALWTEMADCLVLPLDSRGEIILDHDGFHPREAKGATPSALAGLFPVEYPVDPEIERKTIEYFLDKADEYIGSPMLPALYGTWAARIGDRDRAAQLLEEGYAAYVSERFMNTHEYREDRFPEQPVAGPFFANMGAFLTTLIYGLPGIALSDREPETWACRPVVLPRGWNAIEVERVWVRGRQMRMIAEHGAERARLDPLPVDDTSEPSERAATVKPRDRS
jgi:hypothetical protein